MGFGTLFIGYFLLLNVTYYAFTDLVAALIMALGLARLSTVNGHFRIALYISLGFSALGLAEFVLELIRMLGGGSGTIFFVPILRSAVILALTVFMLFGIRDVATEVELPALATRAKRMIPTAALIYAAAMILNTPSLFSGVEPLVVAAVSAIVLIATLLLIIYNLVSIYSAYMRICMPSDKEQTEKPSRFGFINKFREHEAMRAAEYEEYRRGKRKSKENKKK